MEQRMRKPRGLWFIERLKTGPLGCEQHLLLLTVSSEVQCLQRRLCCSQSPWRIERDRNGRDLKGLETSVPAGTGRMRGVCLGDLWTQGT